MNDETIVVGIEGEGARAYTMDRVIICYELPEFEGAMVVVDLYSDEPKRGHINFEDLKALEKYSWEYGVNIRTGEPDYYGVKRAMREVEEEYAKIRRVSC